MIDPTNIPTAIKRLQLIRAFRGHTPNITDCIEITTEKEFAIAENDIYHYSVIVSADTEDKCCHVHNFENTEIALLQIDNKLIANLTGGIADCAVFNTELFHLIEFKTNAEGHSNKAITETYQKAINQLKSTLKLFTDKEKAIGIDFAKIIESECHIIVNQSFPRIKTNEQTLQLRFAQETNTLLNFENEIYF